MLEYDFVIQYKKGISMPADFLSRNKIDEIAAIDPFTPDLAHEQALDSDIVKLKHFHENNKWPLGTSKKDIQRIAPLLNKFFVRDRQIWVRLDDFERQRTALYLPIKFRKRALCEGHGAILSGHDAVMKTYLRITDSYYWPGIKTDISDHIRSCLQCQLRKTKKPCPVPLHPLPISDQPNQRVHVDLFGPLKVSAHANKHILVITDSFTKYAEVIAIPDKQAITVANEIFTHWICRFGSPIQIHSDGGKEFCNTLSDELYTLLDIKHTKTSPAHPQCNAQVEVFNKSLAKYLHSFVNDTTLDWEVYIPAMMFSYNTSYHSTIMTTPFELLYGMKPRTPSFPHQDVQRVHYGESFASERLQILQKARLLASEHLTENGQRYKQQFDKSAKQHDFKIGDLILFAEHNFLGKNKKLAPKWLGPATIVDITETNVKIKCQNGKIKLLNVSHIKHFFIEKSNLKTGVQPELEEFPENTQQFDTPQQPNEILNKPPNRRVTRSLSKLLQEQHTINFVEIDLRFKLAVIADKLYLQQIPFEQLSVEEQTLWSSFEVEDIMFFLTNQREKTPDPVEHSHLFAQKCAPPQQPPVPPPLPQAATPPIRPTPWPKHFMTVDPRNIIATPFQRLTRASANRWRHLDL